MKINIPPLREKAFSLCKIFCAQDHIKNIRNKPLKSFPEKGGKVRDMKKGTYTIVKVTINAV
jgi:hypothetical protein